MGASEPHRSGSRELTATMHLSTFQEVAPLTARNLRIKVSEITDALASGGGVIPFETLGSKWRHVGTSTPQDGAMLSNTALSAALETKLDFTKVELDEFKLDAILSVHSFIKVGNRYLQPDESIVEGRTIRVVECKVVPDDDDKHNGNTVFLPRCQDMPEEAFLDLKQAAELLEAHSRNLFVASYCWRSPSLPDPDGNVLRKIRAHMRNARGGYRGRGLFVDFACLPQCFELPSWHTQGALTRRFGTTGSGLTWECIGETQPSEGKRLDNPALAAALSQQKEERNRKKIQFTSEQWQAFGVKSLQNGHFVKSGALVYKPTVDAESVQGEKKVLRFEWNTTDSIETEADAHVWIEALVGMCEQRKWELVPMATLNGCGDSIAEFEGGASWKSNHFGILFHGRYISGCYRFDKASSPEGYIRFKSAEHAKKASNDNDFKSMCGGKKPKLMGERVFENELKFKRALSVMGCLYASQTRTAVLQLTDPPGELHKNRGPCLWRLYEQAFGKLSQNEHIPKLVPEELTSERTGTVFIVQIPGAGGSSTTSPAALRYNTFKSKLLANTDVLACSEKATAGQLVVRILGAQAARAAREKVDGPPMQTDALRLALPSLHSSRPRPIVYPMYNLRPYNSRGWPTFETAAASMVLAHIVVLPSNNLPEHVKQAEDSAPKLVNIDGTREKDLGLSVDQPPRELLREKLARLKSTKLTFFTGKADRKDVRQLLTDFEDAVARTFDERRAGPLHFTTYDLQLAHIEKLASARRMRSEEDSQPSTHRQGCRALLCGLFQRPQQDLPTPEEPSFATDEVLADLAPLEDHRHRPLRRQSSSPMTGVQAHPGRQTRVRDSDGQPLAALSHRREVLFDSNIMTLPAPAELPAFQPESHQGRRDSTVGLNRVGFSRQLQEITELQRKTDADLQEHRKMLEEMHASLESIKSSMATQSNGSREESSFLDGAEEMARRGRGAVTGVWEASLQVASQLQAASLPSALWTPTPAEQQLSTHAHAHAEASPEGHGETHQYL